MAKNFNMTGLAHWAKVIGDPVENFKEDGNEWTIDVTPDKKGLELLARIGLAVKLRNKDDDREDFITFRRNEFKKDGEPNAHFEIVDADGEPWDMSVDENGKPNKPIGNGSKVKVKFSVFEMAAKGKYKAVIKPVLYKITVLELKEWVKKEKPAAAAKPVSNKPAAKNKDWQGEDESDE